MESRTLHEMKLVGTLGTIFLFLNQVSLLPISKLSRQILENSSEANIFKQYTTRVMH